MRARRTDSTKRCPAGAPAGQVDGQDPASVGHLALGQLVLGMGRRGADTAPTRRPGDPRTTRPGAVPWRSVARRERAGSGCPLRPFMASKGEAQAPCRIEYDHTASSTSAAPVITPRVASLWPAMPLVAECSTTSTPWSCGRWTIGVAKVESTAVNGPPIAPSSSRSVSASCGLAGDSARTRTVRPGRTAAASSPGTVASTKVTSIPKRGHTPCRKQLGSRVDVPLGDDVITRRAQPQHERGARHPSPRRTPGRPRHPPARPPPARRR